HVGFLRVAFGLAVRRTGIVLFLASLTRVLALLTALGILLLAVLLARRVALRTGRSHDTFHRVIQFQQKTLACFAGFAVDAVPVEERLRFFGIAAAFRHFLYRQPCCR